MASQYLGASSRLWPDGQNAREIAEVVLGVELVPPLDHDRSPIARALRYLIRHDDALARFSKTVDSVSTTTRASSPFASYSSRSCASSSRSWRTRDSSVSAASKDSRFSFGVALVVVIGTMTL